MPPEPDDLVCLHPIAHIRTDLPTKFGVPRQSGLVPQLRGTIVFTHTYRQPDALRGLDAFSHAWLIWLFSEAVRDGWAATVRPPRLGGNEHIGVFASRSPFRPNPIGLSSVTIDRVDLNGPDGPTILVSGVDLMDGTPILDIKPYVPYTDAHPDATGGFTDARPKPTLRVTIPPRLLARIPADQRAALTGILQQDPRPPYHRDPARVYGLIWREQDIRFTVRHDELTVTEIAPVYAPPIRADTDLK